MEASLGIQLKDEKKTPKNDAVSILFSHSCHGAITYDVQVNPTFFLENRSFVKDCLGKKDLASYNSDPLHPHPKLYSKNYTIHFLTGCSPGEFLFKK